MPTLLAHLHAHTASARRPPPELTLTLPLPLTLTLTLTLALALALTLTLALALSRPARVPVLDGGGQGLPVSRGLIASGSKPRGDSQRQGVPRRRASRSALESMREHRASRRW